MPISPLNVYISYDIPLQIHNNFIKKLKFGKFGSDLKQSGILEFLKSELQSPNIVMLSGIQGKLNC